jgi:uncharacterized protein YneF (UPF0154 family)
MNIEIVIPVIISFVAGVFVGLIIANAYFKKLIRGFVFDVYDEVGKRCSNCKHNEIIKETEDETTWNATKCLNPKCDGMGIECWNNEYVYWEGRVSIPDIDTDLDFSNKDEIVQYLTKKYGEDKKENTYLIKH